MAPTITTQPGNQTVTAGQTATFTVIATGTAPLAYQWQKNGVSVTGATAASYTTPATTTADSGSTFAVAVSNTAGTVTSAVATLTVNPAPVAPTITTQPGNQTVTAGQTATFTVIATGTAPLAYQWQKNGVSVTGATAASYTTPATTTADSGSTFAVAVSNTAGTVTSAVATLTVNPAYPVKVGPTGRYLVDQNNNPFMIVGDSPQSMLVNLSISDMATYMADRQAHGFNSILVMVLCESYTAGNPFGTTYDSIAPFTIGTSPSDYDLSTPNAAYFQRLDALISTAASYGLVVFLDPIETGGWLTTLRNNGAMQARNYGAFLGSRYKNSPNIVWESGNDFQTWRDSTDNNLVYQVMAGIASADPNHVQTIELDYRLSYSNQDTGPISSVLAIDAAYTYFETYDAVLSAYNSSPTLPTFLTESNYEYENVSSFFSGLTGVFILREQAYWTMTSGACGQLYGNHYTWTFLPGWQNFLDSPGTLELAYWTKLFNSIPWWNLVPDQSHQIVTSGYGTYNGSNGNLPNADYVTTAWITDGSLAIVYDPAGNTLTVNLQKFNQSVTAAWYDPSNGIFTPISGSPFPNSGTIQLTPPGKNHDGDSDWVLVLTTSSTAL
ncbi:MAG: hypothetical protein DMG44_16195 [Acidobacteria bacterium]|nr:MAG: hypothetical protein DMG44_16195 [Acidobacteriota bacterium]